jgi:histone-lysine N-methyltransferase MLL5
MRWNSAPTLVERQRENLTERLRREFGLFLSDDEEQERARKQGELTGVQQHSAHLKVVGESQVNGITIFVFFLIVNFQNRDFVACSLWAV